ncbi:MAG: PIN domain-containing protein [Nitrospirae bacterium]|nr:PIN domain-containing protein [Nitrospirota bacterium]
MASFVALYDACVLYPNTTRDVLLSLAGTDLFRARWTNRIHDEWTANLLRNRPNLADRVPRIRELVDASVPDCLVTGFEGYIDGLTLPDPGDRHVLAAAIRCNAAVIVTTNLKDFPSEALAAYGVEAQHPDDFVRHLLDISAGQVCAALRRQRERLKKPPLAADEFLAHLASKGFTTTVASLEGYVDIL